MATQCAYEHENLRSPKAPEQQAAWESHKLKHYEVYAIKTLLKDSFLW